MSSFGIEDLQGRERIVGTAIAPGASASDVLTADGAGGASWQAGALPDPITSEVTIAPASGDNSLVVKNKEGDTVLAAGDSVGSVQVGLVGTFGDTFTVIETASQSALFHVEANGPLSTDAKLAFFTAPAVTQPVVPLTLPTVQDVITALVALGLVAQHD